MCIKSLCACLVHEIRIEDADFGGILASGRLNG